MQIRLAHVATTDLPVYREHHLLNARLDFVLRLIVSHVLCRLSVDSQDNISRAQVCLGGFTSGGDLSLQETHSNFLNKEVFSYI